MDNDYSKEALMQFLDFITDKGLIKTQTGRGWKVAASKLLTDLSEAEEADVRTIDVDIAARKVANRDPGALTPSSLNEYQHRISSAIQEFTTWRSDPAAYKPRSGNGKPRPKQAEENGTRQERKPIQKAAGEPNAKAKAMRVTSGGLSFDYPLRPDFLAQVVIPRDLKAEEAKRLGAFLLTIASDFSPEQG